MKTKLVLLLSLMILLAACKKNNVYPSIKGTWELRATRYGNIEPRNYPMDNGNVLSFGNSSYARYFAGVMVDTGNYKISTNAMYEYTVFIKASNSAFTNQVTMKQDTLLLIPGNPDAATGFYVRTGYNPIGN
ncbi:MAG: hypothetical protein ACXVA2_13070 [Mucilaginibacter sp.]